MEILWVFISFFCGSIPFAVVIAKTFKGIDPRKEGSKNPGTTNVARLCGFPYGVMTLVCDILKGTIPVFLSIYLFHKTAYSWLPSACAFAAFMGHIKSPFLGFHGGKGVATGIGVLIPLAFFPLLTAVIFCVLVIALTGYVSAGALTLYTTLPFCYYFFGESHWIPLSLVMLAIVLWTHKANIKRLLKGEEKSWRKSKN